MTEDDGRIGTFPFGAALRPARPSADGPRRCFVLGAYPSALHIRWTPPAGRGRAVRALAIDNEPMPFWDGSDEAARMDEWRSASWRPEWGVAESAHAFNGSSGVSLVSQVLRPLDIDPAETWCTDCLDRYHLSVGMAKAIKGVYKPFAKDFDLLRERPVDLPLHPGTHAIVSGAQRERLWEELRAADPAIVITLGEAAFAVLRSLLAIEEPDQLHADERYGVAVNVRLFGNEVAWYPLIHPGQRREPWRPAHDAWVRRVNEAE